MVVYGEDRYTCEDHGPVSPDSLVLFGSRLLVAALVSAAQNGGGPSTGVSGSAGCSFARGPLVSWRFGNGGCEGLCPADFVEGVVNRERSSYEWPRQCSERFGQVPTQVCHEWKCLGAPERLRGPAGTAPLDPCGVAGPVRLPRRPRRTDRPVGAQGRLGGTAGPQMLKTAYAFRLRRNELSRLDIALPPAQTHHVAQRGTKAA